MCQHWQNQNGQPELQKENEDFFSKIIPIIHTTTHASTHTTHSDHSVKPMFPSHECITEVQGRI